MESKPKMYVFEEVAMHNQKTDCWLIISGKVYDVTSFLEDHPGGDDILINVTGMDATVEFEDVRHSDDAKETMSKFYVGEIDVSTLPKTEKPLSAAASAVVTQSSYIRLVFRVLQLLIPVLFAAGFYWIYSRNEQA